MQDYASSNKIKENKYKILRMSLLLGSDDNRQETINNFEEAAREIDAMNDEIYLNDLEKKFYDTLKLEEEEKKLADLVDYIGGRVEQRISLLTDFANVTGYDLTNLPPIKYYDKLDDYKERLKYIREYLTNTEELDKLNKEITDAEKKLNEAYISKATYEENNSRNEEILLNKFQNIIKSIDELQNVDENNVDQLLSEVSSKTEESKKSLEIFTKSFLTLTNSGISYDEEKEYKSYVDNAKELFYSNKEEEYLLTIYKLLLTKEQDYGRIIIKRDNLNNILSERLKIRKDLHISDNDVLENLYDLLDRQYEDIASQRNNIDNIETLTKEITDKKERVSELEQDNQKVEILALLREFCIIDTYTNATEPVNTEPEPSTEESVTESVTEPVEDIFTKDNNDFEIDLPKFEDDTSKEEEIVEDNEIEEPVETEEPAKDNQVIKVEPVTNIDLDLVHAKANKVMKRVGEMLGIKNEETKIVSISNEEQPAEEKIEEPKTTEEPTNDIPTIEENPLFNNNIEEKTEEPLKDESIEDNNFWFPSDTPDALNELPDLEPQPQADNFFTNNNLADLNFPDLNVGFNNNDTEENK